MKVIDVYEQYFEAEYEFNGVPRRGAVVKITATSDSGMITYANSVNFFPHRDEEDYAVSYDAYYERTLHEAKGRRSRKLDDSYYSQIRELTDSLCKEIGAIVYWDRPLREERRG